MAKKPKKKQNDNTIARNRKARFDYTIEDTFEAGLALEGWEVKSLRAGKVQIDESYIFTKNGELEWIGGTITPLISTSTHIHANPTRARKILMHRYEIDRDQRLPDTGADQRGDPGPQRPGLHCRGDRQRQEANLSFQGDHRRRRWLDRCDG